MGLRFSLDIPWIKRGGSLVIRKDSVRYLVGCLIGYKSCSAGNTCSGNYAGCCYFVKMTVILLRGNVRRHFNIPGWQIVQDADNRRRHHSGFCKIKILHLFLQRDIRRR